MLQLMGLDRLRSSEWIGFSVFHRARALKKPTGSSGGTTSPNRSLRRLYSSQGKRRPFRGLCPAVCVCLLFIFSNVFFRQMAHGLQMEEIAAYKKRKAEAQLAKKKN